MRFACVGLARGREGLPRFGTSALYAILLAGGLAAGAAEPDDPARNAYVAKGDPLGEPVAKVVYLEQNWSPAESARFYLTPQGSQLIPYDWFLALEQPDAPQPFRDVRNILRYRYLPQNPGPMNADGLPVGFVAGQGASQRWLGLTCAACHTNEIRLGTTGYRVDGAPTHADVEAFLTDLIGAVRQTSSDPVKFARFAAKVLGNGGTSASQPGRDTPANRADLKAKLELWIKIRVGYNLRNFPGYAPLQPTPVAPRGYGRLDAVDAIVNEVYWHAVPRPDLDQPTVVARAADAPVSYPCLWDTPQHVRVEWLAIAQGGGPLGVFSLARNVGEVLGVFGDFAIPDDPSLLNPGYPSSVKFTALRALEEQLKTLWSPLWPADFPQIDRAAAAKGAEIYETKLDGVAGRQSCRDCHALIDRTDPNRTIAGDKWAVGTDPRAYDNFFHPTRPSGKLIGLNVDFVPGSAVILPQADANSMLTNVVIGTILGFYKDAPPDSLAKVDFGGPRLAAFALQPSLGAMYKARPLNGIWATAPYLHNGSVPNLDALLRPTAERPKSFSIGVRTFDPVRVGYLTDVAGFPRFNVFDPQGEPIVGNSNAGHEYGTTLSDEQRRQLIEYLKTL